MEDLKSLLVMGVWAVVVGNVALILPAIAGGQVPRLWCRELTLGLTARIWLVAVLALLTFGGPIGGICWGWAEGQLKLGSLVGFLVGGVGSLLTLSGGAAALVDSVARWLAEGVEVDHRDGGTP